jgi:hypothetical protein
MCFQAAELVCAVPFGECSKSNQKTEKAMLAILHFITLVVTTMFAAAAAALVNWLLLRGAFHLMRPATAERSGQGGERNAAARRIGSGNRSGSPSLCCPSLSPKS